MNFSINLEDETRKSIETLSSPLIIEDGADLIGFKLLQYLDPYGDTIFNRYQITDLITDLQKLHKSAPSIVISQIISLAKRCKDEIHTYISFNGD